MAAITHTDILGGAAAEFAKFLCAYRECTPEVQTIVDDMSDIIVDKSASNDEKELATHTIIEALFPNLATHVRDCDTDRMSSDGAKLAKARLDDEEAVFAARLRDLMETRGITQERLAELTGVGQPAISNMLTRTCRPQRRTILKFAKALNVEPHELWPEFSGE